LITDVNEILNGGDVDIVDGGEVKDNSLEGGLVRVDFGVFATTWAGVIPRTILDMSVLTQLVTAFLFLLLTYTKATVGGRICAASLLEDGIDEIIEVVICIGVIVSF
jgi:hypothetical protein